MLKLGIKEIDPKRRQRPVNVEKQLRFGVAMGLTKTATEAQDAVLGALRGTFTLRGQWFRPSNRMGIKRKIAKPADLTAEVRTRADWLELHETGGTKRPRSASRLAIPTENVRRNKRSIITKANRPGNLRGKRTFVIKTDSGDVLFQRRKTGMRYQGPLRSGGPTRRMKRTGSELVALYNLEPKAAIRRQSTFYEPITKVVRRRGYGNIMRGMAKALRTAR